MMPDSCVHIMLPVKPCSNVNPWACAAMNFLILFELVVYAAIGCLNATFPTSCILSCILLAEI